MSGIAKRNPSGPLASFIVFAICVILHGDVVLAQDQSAPFPGMDEQVNEVLAEEAGRPSRDPLINTEAWGELWNLLLLAAGAVCGFIVGRHWDQIWGRRRDSEDS